MVQKVSSIDRCFRRAGIAVSTCSIALTVFMFSASGCSKNRFPRDPNLVPISGVVTIDGEPTKSIRVILAQAKDVEQAKNGRRAMVDGPSGVTDEKGAFSITTVYLNDGAAPGDYIVVFDWMPPGVDKEFFIDGIPSAEALKGVPPKVVPIHNKYSAVGTEKTEIKVEAKTPQKDLKYDLSSK